MGIPHTFNKEFAVVRLHVHVHSTYQQALRQEPFAIHLLLVYNQLQRNTERVVQLRGVCWHWCWYVRVCSLVMNAGPT